MPSSLENKTYTISELKGPPFIGLLLPCINDAMNFITSSSKQCGDIIAFNVMGQNVVQLNNPDLIRYVLVENHKNYKKNAAYIRFESAGGLGLLTSNGEKWKRDRQKVQPLFSRELISTYHFEIANLVSEQYKNKWLELTKSGPAEIDITHEMAFIPAEIIMRVVCGHEIDAQTIKELHEAYRELVDYLKNIRVFPRVDSRKLFCMPSYFKFKKALDYIDAVIAKLIEECRNDASNDRRNMLALLVNAQKNNPDHFTDKEIRDQCVTMIFAGFETTSLSLQWMWYILDGYPKIYSKLQDSIIIACPDAASMDTRGMTFESISQMDYLTACFRETLRLYPPFWLTGREPIEDDYFGSYKIKKGSIVILPQLAMHKNPKYWDKPDEFIPERFLPLNQSQPDEGIYFPFNHGPRKCIGSVFSEMEAKVIMAKLIPLFEISALNKENNPILAGISLKLKYPLKVRITRRAASEGVISQSARAYAQ